MKTLIYVVLLILISSSMISGQNARVKKDPVGKWLFEAPYAPEGYKAGSIEVGYADKKYSATMAFSGTENKFTGNKIKFENDTLLFSVLIESQDVAVKLAFTEETKMAGKAVYSEGVVPLTLTREKKKE